MGQSSPKVSFTSYGMSEHVNATKIDNPSHEVELILTARILLIVN